MRGSGSEAEKDNLAGCPAKSWFESPTPGADMYCAGVPLVWYQSCSSITFNVALYTYAPLPETPRMISPGTIHGRETVGISTSSWPNNDSAFSYNLRQYSFPSKVSGEVNLARSFLSCTSAASMILPISVRSRSGSIIRSCASGRKLTQNAESGRRKPI